MRVVQGLGLDPNDLWKYLFQNGQMPNQQGFPVGDSREIDISSLPKELRDIINKSPTEFDEGAEDKIDTESEYRKLLEQMLANGQQIPGVNGSDLQNLSQDELTQLLVEWLLSKQSEQNQPGRDL